MKFARVAAIAAVAVVGSCSNSAGSDQTVGSGDGGSVPTIAQPPSASTLGSPATEPAQSARPTATVTATTAAPTTTPVDPAVRIGELAGAVAAAERGIRDLTLGAAETARWGRAQQRAYRELARHPEWDQQVRELLPPDVLTAFDANVAARRATAAHAAGRPPTPAPTVLPAWTIVEPLPVEELLGYYREAQDATGVPWQYLAAINLIETRMGRIQGASSAGAVGPMQFLPATWNECCQGDVLDPHDAIMGAAAYLVDRGAPGDMGAALYGYSPNAGYVGAVQAYALNLAFDPRAYHGYHAWEVYYSTSAGTIRLPAGYSEAAPIDAAAYAAAHADDVTAGLQRTSGHR